MKGQTVTAIDGIEAPAAISWDLNAGMARVVVRGAFSETTAAEAREVLLEVCEHGIIGLTLMIESGVEPADRDALWHLVDVAQRRCWAISCRLEVQATDPGACEALAATGWGQ